jgi:hypothetical protein
MVSKCWQKKVRASTHTSVLSAIPNSTANRFGGGLLILKVVGNNASKQYRISGHESFACRYTWLPKAVRGLTANPKLFSEDDSAMVELGVGKNMVRSIRFWSQVSGIVATSGRGGGHHLTDFGRALLGESGHDPFMEDIRTLWLIHWNLSTDVLNPLLAWDFLLNRWQEPELVPSVVIKALHKEALLHDEDLSAVTIDQHWDAFLHSYLPTRGRKGEVQEDNLDSPLTELDFITRAGERPSDSSEERAEPKYAFRREDKPEISSSLFVYALNDFWNKRHESDGTLPFREVAHGFCSPGQVFKLPEENVRTRLETIEKQMKGSFSYTSSANSETVTRQKPRQSLELLPFVYEA